MKCLERFVCLALVAMAGACFAGPARPISSAFFVTPMPAGPPGDPMAQQGQWFTDSVSGLSHVKAWEFHDDDQPPLSQGMSVQGVVQSITFDPASNIVAFTVQATVVNNLHLTSQQMSSSNSHYEVQSPIYPSYAGRMEEARIVAEFAVATMALLPFGQPPYYPDPVSGGSYYIEAVNEHEMAWYCWSPIGPTPQGNFQVPTWKLGSIPLGGSASVLMAFQISAPGGPAVMPPTDYRHSVIRYSQMNQGDIFYARHPSLKISHWLDTLLVDNYGGWGWIMAPPGQYEPEPPEYVYASDVSVFFDEASDLDFGDAPDPSYPTLLASNGARHVIVPTVYMGALIDAEGDGQPNATATGDDSSNLADEDGVAITSPLIAGVMASATVTCSLSGFLSAWVDFNLDGSWGGVGEQIFAMQPVNAGPNALPFSVPASAGVGSTFARFRYTTLQAPPMSYTNLVNDGEVEDYEVVLEEEEHFDFGDAWYSALAPGYPTLLVNNGARHTIAPGVFLGLLIDSEPDGQPDAQALGDDNANLADEDGIVSADTLVWGSNATLRIVASTNGYLSAWIDFNQNGSWSDAIDPVASDYPLAPGTNALVVSVPAGCGVGPTFGRFRFASKKGLAPIGLALDGEVEDHAFTLYQPQPITAIAVTNIACCASNDTVTIRWNGLSPAVYDPQYALALTTSTVWTACGGYVTAPPYEYAETMTTQRFYRVRAPFTAP